MKKLLSFLIAAFLLLPTAGFSMDLKELTDFAKKSVVIIKRSTYHSAYGKNQTVSGTGFIANKEQGILITNEHLASRNEIGEYFITFHNGRELKAEFLYSDPLYDFAFLKVDPKELPNSTHQLPIKTGIPEVMQKVYIIGNNEGFAFSLQAGTISSAYESSGKYPTHSYFISLNTKGGSSGSPILNENGEVIALNFAGSDTSAISLNIAYVKNALKQIEKSIVPKRFSSGISGIIQPLDKTIRYADFPNDVIANYAENYPDYLNKIIAVERVLKNTPAYGIIEPYDIIWKVNGKVIGANLYEFHNMLNNATTPFVDITVLRKGKEMTFKVGTYNLENSEISEMLSFNGMTFFYPNENVKFFTGAPQNSVLVSNINVENGLAARRGKEDMMIEILEIDGTPIKSLADVKSVMPRVMQKEFYTIKYINYSYDFLPYDGIIDLNRTPKIMQLKYNPFLMQPTYFTYKHFEGWDKEELKTASE